MDWTEEPDKWEAQPWVKFDKDGESPLWVVRRCPDCGRYIKTGRVYETMNGGMKFEGWCCKTHNEIQPFWVWDN